MSAEGSAYADSSSEEFLQGPATKRPKFESAADMVGSPAQMMEGELRDLRWFARGVQFAAWRLHC